jgi:hypothetical protein
VQSYDFLVSINGGYDRATQYEISFKLSISTFHVSIMAITPATETLMLAPPRGDLHSGSSLQNPIKKMVASEER